MTQAGGLEEKLSDFSLELLVLGIVLEKVKVTFHVIVMSAQNTSIKNLLYEDSFFFAVFLQYILSTPFD